MILVHSFVCFARVNSVCPISLPLSVGAWLWFVIVALPGLFYHHLFSYLDITALIYFSDSKRSSSVLL